MDTYKQTASEAGLYLDTSVNVQPGLEVEASTIQQNVFTERRKIVGLSVDTFWALIVLLCVIVVAGIGGGVGAGLAKGNCKSSIASVSSGSENSSFTTWLMVTQTVTATSFELIPSPTTNFMSTADAPTPSSSSASTLTTSKPSVSAAPYSPCTNQFFTFNSPLIQPISSEGSTIALSGSPQTFLIACSTNYPSGAQYGNPGIHDIMKTYMPDLNQCIMACAEYNAGYATSLQGDVDVGGGLCRTVSMVIRDGEFCYLKNGTGVNDTTISGGNDVRKDSAILQ